MKYSVINLSLEYFSKALGEKTINHSSTSVNRDKQHHKQGYSNSDQIMARALMTPDELRRMDNDLCIIFVKGLRPIKADKFYYFKHPMVKELAECEISHNDIGEIEIGKKFPSVEMIQKFSDALNIRPYMFFMEDKDYYIATVHPEKKESLIGKLQFAVKEIIDNEDF